jgi:nitrogen regulatory protein P-II 1
VKKVEVYFSPARLGEVITALGTIGLTGATAVEVWVRDSKSVPVARFRGASASADLRPQIKLELVVPDFKAEQVVETVRRAARTGERGDGRILVVPVCDALRIRTGEHGEEAL